MVRGMSPKEADALRQKLIKRANQLFTTSSRSRQAAAAAPPSDPAAAAQLLLEKHGVVQVGCQRCGACPSLAALQLVCTRKVCIARR
jgi:hypothetical protein